MRAITLGIALSLLVGSSTLEAQGNFRRIYQSEENRKGLPIKCMSYLKNKMKNVHHLHIEKNDGFEWDLYLFEKFIKSMLYQPCVFDFSQKKSLSYRGYRSAILFMLRSAEPLRKYHDNDETLNRLTSNLVSLDAVKTDITPEEIINWVRSSRHQQPVQLSNKTELAKTIVTTLWKEWRKFEVDKGVIPLETSYQAKL